jgi:Ca2+-dependent lipid-binding protein
MSDEDDHKRRYAKPHSGKHPIPTVQGYREHRKELRGQMQETEEAQRGPEDESKPKRAFESAKAVIKGEDDPSSQFDPYPSTNRNDPSRPTNEDGRQPTKQQEDEASSPGTADDGDDQKSNQKHGKKSDDGKGGKSATENVASTVDPRQKRKIMKKSKRDGGGREVTDPVTHLPIVIHDQTEKDLKYAPENEPEPGSHHRTATGVQGASKSDQELDDEQQEMQRVHNGTKKLFPPPEFERMKEELATVYQGAVYAGCVAAATLTSLALIILYPHGPEASSSSGTGKFFTLVGMAVFVGLAIGIVSLLGQWVNNKAGEIFENETWDTARREERASVDSDVELPESVQWLNSLLSSVWPLINPDLFSSLTDMIEDVMQASLPKAIKMVSVDDMGQGSEAIRILGVRWLPTGAASRSVDSDGKLEDAKKSQGRTSDRTDPQGGTEQPNDKKEGGDGGPKSEGEKNESNQQSEQDEVAVREGLEAEEGDFVNLELAFAYRSSSSGKSIKAKSKNAHLYLKFYLPGGVAVPVWVELRGIIATARLRLQLTPDPPFISLGTLTFLGQPKASMSCVPLSKHSLNLMDVPLISSFVQSSIDAALAEYVAPKSITLNFKDMLVGEDFKKNTTATGVVWIFIKSAKGFKHGDGGIGPLDGSSDSYVAVSWGKFGKPVYSTRIIDNDLYPGWHEWASILVTSEEVNADEKLRLQIWDSDKWTADDDLGRVELDLKELMNSEKTHNKMQDREDPLHGEDCDEKMPGTICWSVGYFEKTRITDQQLADQTVDEDIRSRDQLKQHVSQLSERKLREANKPASDPEMRQQKSQDYKELEDNMIISAPPDPAFRSGILSIQIHNITGLQIQKLNKKGHGKGSDDEGEQADDELPSSYCSVILNHNKIYKTRTKPKNPKPFFNAGTERFVRDWKTAEVIIAVRDAKEGEADPLVGMVYLPLRELFVRKAQAVDNYPLVGGVGYGRIRLSFVWRSVEMKMPKELGGWDFGTLEIKGAMTVKGDNLPNGLGKAKAKLKTNTGKLKMYPSENNGNEIKWELKKKKAKHGGGEDDEDDDSEFLAVRKRYASSLLVEFSQSKMGPDSTPAFAVLWMNELIDEEDKTVTLKLWNGSKEGIKRARASCGYAGKDAGKEDKDGNTKEDETPIGEVRLNVRFWRGLSGYHKSYAAKSKNSNMRDVMECLDTVADEGLDDDSDSDGSDDDGVDTDSSSSADSQKRKRKLRMHTNDDDSTPSNSDSEDGAAGKLLHPTSGLSEAQKGFRKMLRNPIDGATTAATGLVGATSSKDNAEDGARGVRSEMRDYKDHRRQLHRKHRGVMQWRVARQADHLGSKLGQVKGGIERAFSHGEKESGVETEV